MGNIVKNTTKDRKFHFLSLSLCRILSAYALLIFLPVFFHSCDTADSGADDIPVMIRLEDAVSGQFPDCEALDIFIFNDDGLQRLDSYQRIEPSGMEKITAASRKGEKIIAAVANSRIDKSGWSGINSLDALRSKVAVLQKENPGKPLMSGMTYAEMGTDAACTIKMQPLLSEIHIRSIRCDFSGKPYSGEKMQNVKVYLTNVNAGAQIFSQSGFMPQQIVNAGRLSESDLASFIHPEMLMKRLDSPVGNETVLPELSLYCYPNDCREESAGSPFTRFVIEGEISGHRYYYPININREENMENGTGIGRNSRYVYDITITCTGTDDPDIIADPGMIRLSCGILPWTEHGEDEISF